MVKPQPRAPRWILAVLAVGMACGRVSFIGDGQRGDAGLNAPADASGESSSSSSSGGACVPGLGPQPVFTVQAQDVTTAGWAADWSARGCTACHRGANGLQPFTPVMPDAVQDPSGAASSLSVYCQNADGVPPHALTADAELARVRLVCPLIAPAPASSADRCAHNAGTPANNQTLDDVRSLLGPCQAAYARHAQAHAAWLDGGFAPDCGPSGSSSGNSSAGGPGSCPNAVTTAAWEAAWPAVGGASAVCLNCHNGSYPLTPPGCFSFADQASGQQLFCSYARQEGGGFQSGGYTTSRLYLALHGENRRFACTGQTIAHQGFLAGGLEASLEAWHNAIFSP